MRSVDRTENSMVAAVHTFLRSRHSDEDAGLGCFLTGRSTANQRIEGYWSHLAKDGRGWWINFFKDLLDLGLFTMGLKYRSQVTIKNTCAYSMSSYLVCIYLFRFVFLVCIHPY